MSDTDSLNWEEKFSEKNQRKFWYNKVTHEKTWHDPHKARKPPNGQEPERAATTNETYNTLPNSTHVPVHHHHHPPPPPRTEPSSTLASGSGGLSALFGKSADYNENVKSECVAGNANFKGGSGLASIFNSSDISDNSTSISNQPSGQIFEVLQDTYLSQALFKRVRSDGQIDTYKFGLYPTELVYVSPRRPITHVNRKILALDGLMVRPYVDPNHKEIPQIMILSNSKRPIYLHALSNNDLSALQVRDHWIGAVETLRCNLQFAKYGRSLNESDMMPPRDAYLPHGSSITATTSTNSTINSTTIPSAKRKAKRKSVIETLDSLSSSNNGSTDEETKSLNYNKEEYKALAKRGSMKLFAEKLKLDGIHKNQLKTIFLDMVDEFEKDSPVNSTASPSTLTTNSSIAHPHRHHPPPPPPPSPPPPPPSHAPHAPHAPRDPQDPPAHPHPPVSSASSISKGPPPPPPPPKKRDPALDCNPEILEKFRKLAKIFPEEVVRHKMSMDNLDNKEMNKYIKVLYPNSPLLPEDEIPEPKIILKSSTSILPASAKGLSSTSVPSNQSLSFSTELIQEKSKHLHHVDESEMSANRKLIDPLDAESRLALELFKRRCNMHEESSSDEESDDSDFDM